ncbi:MAG: proline racemase family protein [Anaerolineae bacterium]|nr:proline racemase family protein [Anaerolineae bacterium]
MKLTRMISTIDSHTAGEGTRLVISGLPPIPGDTIAAKLAYAAEQLSWLPGWLLREPRGHKDLFGAVLVAPCTPGADAGVLFMDNNTFEPACGHATIGVATTLLAAGIHPAVEPRTRLILDTGAGPVETWAVVRDGEVEAVSFDNVPAFVLYRDVPVPVAGLGEIVVDVAFGGNFFTMVDVAANDLNVDLVPAHAGRLAHLGMRVLAAANDAITVRHPELPNLDRMIDLRFYQTLSRGDEIVSRNVVILGDHMVDRSPCGTGTCAEMALRYDRGELALGQPLIAESIMGTRFRGELTAETRVRSGAGAHAAVCPRVTGSAYVTGFHQFIVQPGDPFPRGFLLESSG